MQIHRTNFQSRNNYFWKVPILHIIQNHWKKTSSITSSSVFNLTLEHIQLDNFCLWNCLWAPNTYRLVVQKVLLFQMLGETSICTLPGKVILWQKIPKWCFVWQYKYGCLSLHIEIEIFLQKYLFYNNCLESYWSIVVKKWNDIPSQKGLSNCYPYKHDTYSRYHTAISNKIFIMKILKYVCSYTMCMLI